MLDYEVSLRGDFNDWREQSRALLRENIPPQSVIWRLRKDAQDSFENFSQPFSSSHSVAKTAVVPRSFLERAEFVAAHRNTDRWALLYRILWRLTHDEPDLLQISIDPDIQLFDSYERLVRRDLHKMKAFVRFREVSGHFIAWHEPDHLIVKLAAPFFQGRFPAMNWTIMTPYETVHWNEKKLIFSPGLPRSAAPTEDEVEDLWKTYYAAIFNPARMKIRAMKKEMAVRYWKNMPETGLIPGLIQSAHSRIQEFYKNQTPGIQPTSLSIEGLRNSAKDCRACSICEKATQTVFGEGLENARIVFVGEQPGDEEDLKGKPFIGPAGQLLNQVFTAIGADRSTFYVTNAVKHFKWTLLGKRRLHQRPTSSEVATCKPWLNSELQIIKPKLLICLGATAAQSVLGKMIKISDVRGRAMKSTYCENTWITIHPSAILRTLDPDQRARELHAFTQDIRKALLSIDPV
jgi:probable DNA metabolism protein